MRITVALLTMLAMFIAAPLAVLGQGAPPPSQPAPSQPSPSMTGTTIEGVIANVDTTCGGKPAAGCQIVEITASPSTSTPGATPSTSTPGATPPQTTKIMIPKDAKITSQDAQSTKPVQLAKGDKVKITYDKKPDGNVATSVTLIQKAGQ
jgi:hypothetical protein